LAFILFRVFKYWDQAAYSQAAGISPNQVSLYEQGRRAVPDEILRRASEAVGFPVSLLPFLLKAIRTFRLIAESGGRFGRLLGGAFSVSLLGLGHAAAELVAVRDHPPETAPPCPQDERERASALWDRMRGRPHPHREALVDEDEEYRTWGLVEQVAAASIEAAGDDPQEALKLAELAVRIAELCPGPEAWRWRLEGYARIQLANARQVSGDLPGAREAIAHGKKLWQAGAPADPGLLNEALVLRIEASLADSG
jgi:transcriptional regulator with XRE-family HTH domain